MVEVADLVKDRNISGREKGKRIEVGLFVSHRWFTSTIPFDAMALDACGKTGFASKEELVVVGWTRWKQYK